MDKLVAKNISAFGHRLRWHLEPTPHPGTGGDAHRLHAAHIPCNPGLAIVNVMSVIASCDMEHMPCPPGRTDRSAPQECLSVSMLHGTTLPADPLSSHFPSPGHSIVSCWTWQNRSIPSAPPRIWCVHTLGAKRHAIGQARKSATPGIKRRLD
eukprot:349741-Chlamydomonas_euryale.AAC.12